AGARRRYGEGWPIRAARVRSPAHPWRGWRRTRAVAGLAAGLVAALAIGQAGVTRQWRQAVANLTAAEAATRKAQSRFDLAMEAVQAVTAGASEDVLLRA